MTRSRGKPSRPARRRGDPRQGRLNLSSMDATAGVGAARSRVGDTAADPWGLGRGVGARERRGLYLAQLLVIVVACGLALRVGYVQTVRRDFYARVAERLQPAAAPDAPLPGRILDSQGRVLADAERVVDLAVDPVTLRAKEDLAQVVPALTKELRLPSERLDRLLAAKAGQVYLARRVTPAVAEKVLAHRWAGITQEPSFRRVYPHGTVACHVLGAYSGDQRPLAGLDLQYRFVLQGQPGTPQRNVDAWGRTIIGSEGQTALPPVPGSSLVTTLDLDAQRATEAALDRLCARNRPENAVAVVMEPRTGAILALAARPNYDPNAISSAGAGVTRAAVSPQSLADLPVSWVYEPGSTFKLLMAAAGLESGAVTTASRFHCGGVLQVGGRPLHCWGPWAVKGHGSLDLAGILAQSCNLGAAQAALRIGPDRYVNFLKACGIGSSTRVGLPGEAAGLLPPAKSLRTRDLANMGFGQHVSVTPLQLTAAICALVNDGRYMQPQLVRRVLGPEGTVRRDLPPVARGQVCSVETSRRLRQMMVGVVERGTGRSARLPGVAMGGKTGTAQVYDPQTGTFPADKFVVSFVLAAPADRVPDFVILVTALNPQVGEHGSDVAGPAAKEIAQYLLQQRGLLPWATPGANTGTG